MKRQFAFSMTLLLVLACSSTTQDSRHTALSGTWSLNHEQSDNGREVIRKALRVDPAATGGEAAEKREAAIERLDQLFGGAELLEIRVGKGKVTMMSAQGGRAWFTDGRGTLKGRPDLDATWDGGKLLATVSYPGGALVHEVWETTPDSAQMYVTYNIEGSMFSAPLTLHRVYDRQI